MTCATLAFRSCNVDDAQAFQIDHLVYFSQRPLPIAAIQAEYRVTNSLKPSSRFFDSNSIWSTSRLSILLQSLETGL